MSITVRKMSVSSFDESYYSVTGGVLSAFGSLLGKLAGILDSWAWTILCFACMVAVNTAGFTLFAKALNASSTSLRPTLLSTASSYVTSALLGLLVFSEETSLLWWTGTTLILAGVLTISLDKQKVD